MTRKCGYSADEEWQMLLGWVLDHGEKISPRGKTTLEIPAFQSSVDMKRPIVTVLQRDLGYRFMAAEAYWILSGDQRVENIDPYSKAIAQFSDNGYVFQGAYGPKVVEQLRYVVDTLAHDPSSRQAVINIWRESPRPSKDTPCTLSLQFLMRNMKMDCIASMRSSDSWLGWPYDVFNFTMITTMVCLMLLNEVNAKDRIVGATWEGLDVGTLFLTAGSQHLYKPQWEIAKVCRESKVTRGYLDHSVNHFISPRLFLEHLCFMRDAKKCDIDPMIPCPPLLMEFLK